MFYVIVYSVMSDLTLLSCKFYCYIYTFLMSGEENARLGVGISWKLSPM